MNLFKAHREAAKSAKKSLLGGLEEGAARSTCDVDLPTKKTSRSSRLCGALLLLALSCVAACKKATPPEPRKPRAIAAETASETPAADKVIAEADDDPSWIAGTWKKDGENRWLLFNLPAEAAELAGKPARVVRRGKLTMHGRYASAIFQDGELQIEGSKDHAELNVPGSGRYRRGAPP